MHPALSVVFFTTASGAGYGLLLLLGLSTAMASGLSPFFCLTVLFLACALITFGLLASTVHLGQPARAWRAFSQWRTSWLSREGVAAIVTFIPAGILGVGWLLNIQNTKTFAAAGLSAAAMSAVTVYCTAMIYASLRPIHQWHNAWVVPIYLLLALYSGAVLLNAAIAVTSSQSKIVAQIALVAGLVALACKWRYWRFIDTTRSQSTIASATGLGALGNVRLLDAPHTEDNYLLREMAFRIARKHGIRLRGLVFGLAFALPCTLVGFSFATDGFLNMILAAAAGVSVMVGIFIERWLFFAQAKHTVTLYYGAATA